MSIEVKSFSESTEVNEPNNAKVEAIVVGGQRIMRLTLQPGWKWSSDIKPNVGTDSCQTKHLGIIISGEVHAVHDDGTSATYKSGDAYSIEPGHDAWVVGSEAAICFEFHGAWGE